MGPRRLLWQLYPAYLLITLAALLAVWWFATQDLGEWYLQTVTDELHSRAALVAEELAPYFPGGAVPNEAALAQARSICTSIAQLTKTRVTLILPDGQVVADTGEDIHKLDNHRERPEVQTALTGQVGVSTRFSATLNFRMRYLAFPLERDQQVAAIVRVALPLSAIDSVRRSIQWKIAGGGLAAALLAAAASWLLTRRISQPLEEMRRGAERFARGELGYKLPLAPSEELAGLADALNQMARQLEERIRTVVQQRNERDAILSSMAEGVLAVDRQERIISLNRAAAALIGATLEDASGRCLAEVVRHADLVRFVREILAGNVTEAQEIVLHRVPERVLRIQGAALTDAGGQSRGAVVVLNDMTQFRHLETVRRDFVAN
ncbi:MAG TPA: PAS domain-containing protein, partial [Pirellulales bacterium]|nr:PAS domain-containing protein [Pirellulales bacterium]